MGSLLGFRSPQFSEDGAWLPCWLQQEDCDAEASVPGLEQGKSSPERCVEGHHNCQKHICNISADQFLGEEGRYTNCHLYLSGDDSSVLTVTPSIDNVTQFHLHLSLDYSSVGMPSPSIDAFHVEMNEYSDLHVQHPEVSEPKSNDVLNAEQNIDAIVCSLVPEFQRTENDMTTKELEEKSRSLEVEQICDAVVPSQSIVDHNVMNCSLAPECDRAPEDQSWESLDEETRLVEIEQTDDAVEMSISASEALVIHEVLRTLSSELPVSSVLEAALQLKQARLEVWNDSHETNCNPLLEEEITDTEYHLDSEDIHKEDVYDHLGDNLSVSQVKDTLDSEVCGQDRKSKLASTSTSQYDHLQGYNLSVSQVKDTLDSESCGQDRKSKPVAVQLPNTEQNLHGDDFTNRKMEVHENDHQLTQNTAGSYDCDWHNKSTMGLRSTSMSHQNNPMLHLLGQTEDHTSTEDCSLQANLESPCAKRSEIEGQYYGVSGTVCNRFQSRWFGGWYGNDANISVPMRPNNIKIIPSHFAGETSSLSESADIAPDENSFVGPKPDEKAFIASKSAIPSEDTHMNMNNQVLSQDASRFSSPSYVDPLCSVVPCSIPSQDMLSRSALCDNKQVNMEKFFTPGTEHTEKLQSNSNLDNKVLSEQIFISEVNADRTDHFVHEKLISMRSISMRPCYVSSLKNRSLGKTCLLEKSLPPPNIYGSTEIGHGFPSGLQKEMNSHFFCMTKGSVQHLDHFSSEFSAEANGEQIEGSKTVAEIPPHPNLLNLQLIHENKNITSSGTIKRVRFAEHETKVPHGEKRLKQQITSNACHTVRASKCLRLSCSHFESRAAQNKKGALTNCQAKFVKTLLFQSMKFLLTGFPKQKLKRIEDLIRKYGGTVLTDIPFENKRKRTSRHREQTLPVVLCPKKLQTMKFLYGCAVGALMVKAKWLTDSIAARSLLPPERYMILRKSFGGSLQTEILLRGSSSYIFDGVGIMLHGSKRNCSGIAKVIEHGGGRVFKTLQNLVSSLDVAKITVGFIVTEDGSWTSRHLKQCALEKKIPIVSVQWIVNSLHAQKLLPFTEKKDVVSLPLIKLPDTCSIGWSQEI